jgi:hypothetical protein
MAFIDTLKINPSASMPFLCGTTDYHLFDRMRNKITTTFASFKALEIDLLTRAFLWDDETNKERLESVKQATEMIVRLIDDISLTFEFYESFEYSALCESLWSNELIMVETVKTFSKACRRYKYGKLLCADVNSAIKKHYYNIMHELSRFGSVRVIDPQKAKQKHLKSFTEGDTLRLCTWFSHGEIGWPLWQFFVCMRIATFINDIHVTV